ncbi:hypothetical protein D3C81_1127160 [compost metagenome]
MESVVQAVREAKKLAWQLPEHKSLAPLKRQGNNELYNLLFLQASGLATLYLIYYF